MASPIHHVFDPISHWTLQDPARVAVRFENRSWTWQQLSDRVHSNAAAQSALGLTASGRVAFLDKNHPDCIETTLACALVGTVNAVVNFRLAPSELVYVLNDSQAELVFVGAEFVETFELIKPELLHLRKTVVVGGDADEYEDWLQNAPEVAMTHAVSPDDCFLQLYTSGTTGYPKGAMLTHRSLGAHSNAASVAFGFERDSVNMVAMPLFHVGGTSWALAAMSQGAETIVVREVVPDVVLEQIARQSVTHAFFVPAVIRFFLQIPGVAERDLGSLRCLGYGGSPMPEALLRTAMKTFDVDFYQVYGIDRGVRCVLCACGGGSPRPRASRTATFGRAAYRRCRDPRGGSGYGRRTPGRRGRRIPDPWTAGDGRVLAAGGRNHCELRRGVVQDRRRRPTGCRWLVLRRGPSQGRHHLG